MFLGLVEDNMKATYYAIIFSNVPDKIYYVNYIEMPISILYVPQTSELKFLMVVRCIKCSDSPESNGRRGTDEIVILFKIETVGEKRINNKQTERSGKKMIR